MKKSMKIEIRRSEIRSRLAAIGELEGDAVTDEIRAERDGLVSEYARTEPELRAARIAEDADDRAAAATNVPEPEHRERESLRRKARLGRYMTAAMNGRRADGAEAEFRAAACGDGAEGIPIALFDAPPKPPETRADVVSPAGTHVGVNIARIAPAIFARSVLPRLGVVMPQVPTGTHSVLRIGTSLTAGAVAKGAKQESTAAAMTAVSTTPHRVSGRLSIAAEDLASIGTEAFEPRLRQNLMLVMSDQLDKVGLTGDPSSVTAQPNGLFTQLTNPADPGEVATWDDFVGFVVDGIDGGPWAETTGAVVLCANTDILKLAEKTFRDKETASTGLSLGSVSAARYVREISGGFFASSRMPATASNIASMIRFRAGTMGLDGVNAIPVAECPVWDTLTIDDPYSDSGSAIRHLTMHALIGDVIRVHSEAHDRVDVKVS